ncbi:uncharacterized protein LOC134833465 [Culicoides brevitarsis]|uniref:uncharacterized protein LOC134833465 n=1 Tax=Culicoides brevitarsis TaxID=469753 RepID=UPI00307C441E
MKTKLVKWSIQKKDHSDTRQIIYSEEDFDVVECDGLSKEQKLEVIRSQYESFFKTTSNIFSETTKRWMKIGDVDVFYKDFSGDEILIDNEMAYYYFLRNVNEVLKTPIELIVKDFMDEQPKLNLDMAVLNNICEKCGAVKTCGVCEMNNFNPETPISITTDLEKTLNVENSTQNVKLWRPDSDLEEGEILSDEEKIEPTENTEENHEFLSEKEVLDDNNNEFEDKEVTSSTDNQTKDENSTEIEVTSTSVDQTKADNSFDMEVNKQFEAKTTQEPKNDPPRLVYSQSDLLDIRENAPKVPPRQNPPIIPSKVDQIRAIDLTKKPPPVPARSKTPINVHSPSLPEMGTALQINEQVIEQPETINLDPYNPIDRKNAGTRFKMNDILWGNYRVKPGYSDLDDPSVDEEHSFEAVNWKAATGRQKMLNSLMTVTRDTRREPKENRNFLVHPECAFGKTQLNGGDALKKTTSAPPVETSNWNKSKLQRKIPLPRPLRTNV